MKIPIKCECNKMETQRSGRDLFIAGVVLVVLMGLAAIL